MTIDLKKCPNCGELIKDGVFKTNNILQSKRNDLINEYSDTKTDVRCENCGKSLYDKYYLVFKKEQNHLLARLKKSIHAIPLASIHSPLNWDYSVIGMVTAQSTTGTGVISEFTSSFTDFFGSQSGAYNEKLAAGENRCKDILRKRALDNGGNAVLGVDIDYAEVGGGKGMLMVAMTGTAVHLKNPNVLKSENEEFFSQLEQIHERMKSLSKYQYLSDTASP